MKKKLNKCIACKSKKLVRGGLKWTNEIEDCAKRKSVCLKCGSSWREVFIFSCVEYQDCIEEESVCPAMT